MREGVAERGCGGAGEDEREVGSREESIFIEKSCPAVTSLL